MSPSEEISSTMSPMKVVYAVLNKVLDHHQVVKRKNKSLSSTQKHSVLNHNSQYDEVGSLIEGTYEKQPQTRVSNIIDDPYEILGNFLDHNHNDESNDKYHLSPPTSLQCSENGSVRPSKLRASVRMKQQRTSRKKRRCSQEYLVNFTHENVVLTPPLLVRSSPVISRASLNKISRLSPCEQNTYNLITMHPDETDSSSNTDHIYEDPVNIISKTKRRLSYEKIWDARLENNSNASNNNEALLGGRNILRNSANKTNPTNPIFNNLTLQLNYNRIEDLQEQKFRNDISKNSSYTEVILVN